MSYYKHKENRFILITIVAFLFLSAIVTFKTAYSKPHYETITIKDKSVYPGKSTKWLIYTEHEVYSVNDLLFVGYFDSSDVYNSLHVGETYEVYVSGERIPYLSSYKVIRHASKITIY